MKENQFPFSTREAAKQLLVDITNNRHRPDFEEWLADRLACICVHYLLYATPADAYRDMSKHG